MDPADRPGPAAVTRAQTGKRIAFVAGGRLQPGPGTPVVEGQFSTAFELAVGRAGADALFSRLRG